MKVERRIEARGDDESLREGVRAYFLGEGYEELSDGEGAQEFRRVPTGFSAHLASRIESLPRRVTVRRGPERGEDLPRSLWLTYEVSAGWRLITRLDLIYFTLEARHLTRYLDSGHRGDTSERLDRLRRPVGTAVLVNVVVASLLVAVIGRLVGFPLPLLVGSAVVVALVNLVSIVGFADLVIEGMDRLDH